MSFVTFQELVVCSFVAILIAAIVYWLFDPTRRLARYKGAQGTSKFAPSFLFEGMTLQHASDGAEELIAKKLDNMPDWEATLLILSEEFPSVEAFLSDIPDNGVESCRSKVNPDVSLTAERTGTRIRLTVQGIDPATTRDVLHRLDQLSLLRELELLRTVAHDAPQLIWQEDDDGKVTWCSRAYLSYADRANPHQEIDVPIWPAKPLFDDLKRPPRHSEFAQKSTLPLVLSKDDAEHWFNITSIPNANGTLHVASDANDQVRSERDQKAFIQTFSKTFAQLSIGLAIFDRSHNLSMFNPALVQMTGLSINLLSARPSIEAVLDQLRETGKLPEPKDYTAWRIGLTQMVDDAKLGTYHELWNLTDGQTFRVTGRPHLDGAIALLFEDVSAEVSLTRRFRGELETSQSVLDALPDAIAVFSHSSSLVLSNAAYAEMWDEPHDVLQTVDLHGALETWTRSSSPTRVWRRIESFANSQSDRTPWRDSFVLNNGRQIVCHVQSVGGGMIMVKFSKQHSSAMVMNRLVERQDNIPAMR